MLECAIINVLHIQSSISKVGVLSFLLQVRARPLDALHSDHGSLPEDLLCSSPRALFQSPLTCRPSLVRDIGAPLQIREVSYLI